MRNKAQSQIVATVILILLVVVSAGIIVGIVVPFVQEKLETTGCLDILGEVSITDNLKYSCYDIAGTEMKVQIHVGGIDEGTLEGIQIVLEKEGSSDSYKVNEGSTELTMLGGSVELPGKNEERTYIINVGEKPDAVRIYPILEDEETCDASDSLLKISSCI